MAAVASSSRLSPTDPRHLRPRNSTSPFGSELSDPTSPTSPTRRRTRDSDVFRPRLPRDPFPSSHHDPFLVPADRLASPHPLRRDVVLVLGDPTPSDLAAFLHSPHLAASLLILATPTPESFSRLTNSLDATPALRILALSEPPTGTLRLSAVLEWAARVARAWRAAPGPALLTLHESDPDPALARKAKRESTQYARSASPIRGGVADGDAAQRPLDALVHVLPRTAPDKDILRETILLTTLAKPFLAAPPAQRPSYLSASSSASGTSTPPRRTSVFRASVQSLAGLGRSSVYLPATPPLSSDSLAPAPSLSTPKAHLVHVLPSARPSPPLVARLEAFLRSTTTLASSSSSTLSPSAVFAPSSLPSPASLSLIASTDSTSLPTGTEPTSNSSAVETYLLPAPALAEPVRAPDWTLADVLLAGALDGAGPGPWVAGADAVRVVGGRAMGSGGVTPPSPTRAASAGASPLGEGVALFDAKGALPTFDAKGAPPLFDAKGAPPLFDAKSALIDGKASLADGLLAPPSPAHPAPERRGSYTSAKASPPTSWGPARERRESAPGRQTSLPATWGPAGALPTPPDSEEDEKAGLTGREKRPGRWRFWRRVR